MKPAAVEESVMEEIGDVKDVAVKDIKISPSKRRKFVVRLYELPIVNSLCERVSGVYGQTRERNVVVHFGIAAAEVTFKTALVTTQMVYSSLPSTGLVGDIKDSFEEKVSQVDAMACDGLEFLQRKWLLVKDNTLKVVDFGATKLEQSDLAEVLLTVTEAAVDYFKPIHEKEDKVQTTNTTAVVQTKIDRIRVVSHTCGTILHEGTEVLSHAVSTGIDGAKSAAQWSCDITQSLLLMLPVVDRMLAAFPDPSKYSPFIFSPPVLGEGRRIIGRRQNLRRSKRRKVKGNYHRMMDATDAFSVSPDRKRKYEQGEGTLIEELIHVSENYDSDEDPDYIPDNDEDDSETSDDEEEDEGGDRADTKEEQNQSKTKVSGEQEAMVHASSLPATSQTKPKNSSKVETNEKKVSPTNATRLKKGKDEAAEEQVSSTQASQLKKDKDETKDKRISPTKASQLKTEKTVEVKVVLKNPGEKPATVDKKAHGSSGIKCGMN